MNIKNYLDQFSTSRIFFEDTSLTYGEISNKFLNHSPSPFIWNGTWTSKHFIEFLSALYNQSPIICSLLNEENFPKLSNGEIAFRTSGSEGERKWMIHKSSTFLTERTLTFERNAKALLSPYHAAGFDFMFHALRQGANFGFSKLETLKDYFLPDVIFGPPQALSSILFFQQKNQDILNNLKSFYSSTDSLNSEITEKCKKLGLSIKLKTFYGSTETMMIWNETHPNEPGKIKLRSGEGYIEDNSFIYTGQTLAKYEWVDGKVKALSTPYKLGDSLVVEDGWINLIKNNRNIIKVWGHSLNLKELENKILGLPEVAHVLIHGKNDAFGTKISITIFGKLKDKEIIKSIFPKEMAEKTILVINFRDPTEIDLKKPKRLGS